MVMTIAALQYSALRLAWPVERAARNFSEQDEAAWGEAMEALWRQMTPAEQEAVESDLDQRDGPTSPQCPATFEGKRCAYERSVVEHLHWTITDAGEVTWTEESVALHALAMQLQRLADGVESLSVRVSESSKG